MSKSRKARKGELVEATACLTHTAVHEAGHAVVGRVLILPCGHATIVPNDAEGTAGHAITKAPDAIWEYWLDNYGICRPMPVIFRARIISCMAGAEAEKELLGFCQGGDGEDQYQIACMADEILDTWDAAWDRWAARLRRQTARLVRRHRDKIERVAKALLERKTLQAPEIDALMV